jgi:replicative DNA helicase
MARVAEDTGRRTRPEKVPPHNLEAEESVLGSMMLSGEAIAEVIEILEPDDFYRSSHRRIYESLLSVYARGEPVDAITTVEELKRLNILEDVGGPLRIHELVEGVPTPAGAAYYARIVSELALLRRLIHAASEIMEMAYSVPEDPNRTADAAEARIYSVSRRHEKEEVVSVRMLVDQAMVDLENIQQRDSAYAGTPTGFRDVDTLLSGLQRGNLIVVAARPGVGKSSFVTNLARNVSVDSRVGVAMFSLEMSRWEIGMRLLCGDARVPWDRVRAGRVGPEDWSRIVEAAEGLHDAPLYIVDSGNVTIVDIRAKARRLRQQRNLGLVIVDYLQLMSHPGRVDNRQQEIAEISRSLKLLAKELDIPVIAVSQLNRQVENRSDKRPQLSDLRECVTGDTRVALVDGRHVPIADLVGSQPEVLAVSPEGKMVRAKADKVWSVGTRPFFEVRLASGRVVRATGRHRLYGADGWVRVDDLNIGDRLAIARRLPGPPSTDEWPDDRVALLGQLIGDGSYLINAPMRYTTASEENSELVATAARREFGSKVTRYAGRGSWHQLLISGNGNRWHPAGVNAWLRQLGVFGQRSAQKRIPEPAFRLGDRQIALLLRHLWATDGAIWIRPPTQYGSSHVFFSTCSRGLADDVAMLLLRLGIVARIRTAHQRGATWHSVAISGANEQHRFLDVVGSVGTRVEPARRLARALSGVRANTNVDTLPQAVFERVKLSMARRGLTGRDVADLRRITYGGESHYRFAPSRHLLAEYAELLDDDELRRQATSDLFWDRIVSIESGGEQEVFDLTVPGPSSWLAGAVMSHNSGSIEQDSDIVMFIHRDDSVDPERKGTADIVVAKHRNGPTDTVKLTFLPHLTQFRNYAPGV